MQHRIEDKKRTVKQRILILCEGKTEQLYFLGLKNSLPRNTQRDIEIQIVKTKNSEPQSSIKEAVKKRAVAQQEQQPFKEVWMVFDDDNRLLEPIFASLKKEKIKPAFSSISIEYWFILHHEKTQRIFNKPAEALTHLQRLMPNYVKTNSHLWSSLNASYAQAKLNAEGLRKQANFDNNSYNAHKYKPFTNMDELTECLLNYS